MIKLKSLMEAPTKDMSFGSDRLEIHVNKQWVKVDPWIFRSWAGPRRRNGQPYKGPLYFLGTDEPTGTKDEDTYVAQKDGASVTFDADTDTDAEKQAGDMKIGRPRKVEQRSGGAPTGTPRSGLGFLNTPKSDGYPIRKEAAPASLTAQLKAAKKAYKDFNDHYTTEPVDTGMDSPHNRFVNDTGFELRQKVVDLEKQLAAQRTKKEASPPSKPPVHPNRVTTSGGKYHVTGIQSKKETASPAWAYVQRIQKSDKRAFAAKYLSWLQGGKKGPAPTRPEAWKNRAGYNDWQKIQSSLNSLTDQPVEGLQETEFKPGQKVQHFSNPEAIATVVRYQPDQDYPPPYLHGSWHDHSFSSGGLVVVKWPNGRTEETFASEWKPAGKLNWPSKEGVQETYKQLRPLRKLIREELRRVLFEQTEYHVSYKGFEVSYRGGAGNGVVTVSKHSQADSPKFDDDLNGAYDILSKFRMTKPGSEWGTDGVGYAINKRAGKVVVHKSGVVPKNAKAAFAAMGASV